MQTAKGCRNTVTAAIQAEGVFSLMMQDKVKALNVYNVLGNSHFDNPEDVEIITTDGGISLSVRNDASFTIV